MKCAFCGCEFSEHQAEKSCSGCAVLGQCKRIKCPRCGYESPKELGIINAWRRLKQRLNGGSSTHAVK